MTARRSSPNACSSRPAPTIAGSRWRGAQRFEGSGVYYAATPNEVQQCRGADVAVVGGGNSAGQAAVFLAGQARKVYLLIRGGDLYKQMSSYLAQRIEQTPNIEVLLNTSVERMLGDGQLTTIEVVNRTTGEKRTLHDRRALQLHRRRAADRVAAQGHRDRRRAASSGPGRRSRSCRMGRRGASRSSSRPAAAACSPPVTSAPSSVKRVASAVGEGSMAIQFVHEYLKEM